MADQAPDKRYVFVCTNVDCRVRGAGQVMTRLADALEEDGIGDVELRPYMCFGGCHDGPNVVVYPDKIWYAGVKEEDADTIVNQHLKQGETVTPLTGKIDKNLEQLIFQLLDAGVF